MGRPGSGFVVCLAGLGLAAAVTIIAFFGTGLLLLNGRAGGIDRLRAAPAPVADAAVTGPAPAGNRRSGSLAGAIGPVSPAAKADAAAIAPAIQRSSQLPTAAGAGTPTPNSVVAAVDTAAAAGEVAQLPLKAPAAPAPPVTAAPTPNRSTATALEAGPMPPPVPPTQSAESKEGAAAAASPVAAALPAAEVRALLIHGDAAFRRGDLTAARLLYRRAFEAGDGHGAMGLGASYDPAFLRRFHIWTQVSDRDEARRWYLRARELGAPEAADRLDQLSSKPAR
jgi:hypothetical protein